MQPDATRHMIMQSPRDGNRYLYQRGDDMAARKKVVKRTKKSRSFAKEVSAIISGSYPESLTGEGKRPIPNDHAAHCVQLIGWGHTRLAADHLLLPEINGRLDDVFSGILRRLNLSFKMSCLKGAVPGTVKETRVLARFRAYEFLLEAGLNFQGHESGALDDMEKSVCFYHLINTLRNFEAIETAEYGEAVIAAAAVAGILAGMELVQGGASMTAKSAGRIKKAMRGDAPATIEFLLAAGDEIESNIYFQIVAAGDCKFGNDYALGLRWLRHLGFEQVSTNPVLAALAYKDDPSLKEAFRREVVNHPKYADWAAAPGKHGDEIALNATLAALWDNLHVFRPVFYNHADTTGGGVVSFQLNPNIADRAKESIADAFDALAQAQADLDVYDAYLLAGYQCYTDLGRPNMVIKVAASHPAAREIASTINAYGLGSNITVVYTVAQQITMIIEELAGMAAAIKKGITPTQLYMTNMGGRFESHLREVVLEDYFMKLKKKIGEKKAVNKIETLARANGSLKAVKAAASYKEKVVAATAYKSQKVIDGKVAGALRDVAPKRELEQWEADIAKSGTLVARRVWHIFFSEKNREKWIDYLCESFGIEYDQAFLLMSRLNYLPASKRKPLDTFWTITSQNMVHTEFGNHQENVLQMSWRDDFDMMDYVESIRDDFEPEVVERLNRLDDFRIGYEINSDLKHLLDEAGIAGDYGTKGHKPVHWQQFGSVMKTSAEFRKAYDDFKEFVLEILPKQ